MLQSTQLKREQFLTLIENSLDIYCPQNEIRLVYEKNKLFIIKNVTKEIQNKSIEYFYESKYLRKNKMTKEYIKWEKTEIEYLKNNSKLCIKNLAEALNKSEYQVACMIGKLKLYEKKKWNDLDDSYLKENYLKKSDLEIADYLNRSLASVKSRRKRLNLLIKK
ncbi:MULTISPECIES: hypothetical protein [Cetobacterium]|jgi:hypothetical protein|uniref:Uncharacterized protein n=1 Tax=Candidatus Cetobacterium colombiensis TaxID=3073100 RepID=A0ABU4W8M2_9FUSO|nr:hypothetical protein [Candidatus Cetobacterium colombiensis]MDX8335863.1 hypothetical protein [Candidatus Cetobacterium colombiensis]